MITWAAIELPPSTNLLKPYPETLDDLGDGASDIITRAIAARIPDYQHKVVGLNAPRLFAEMTAGKPMCIGSAPKTPDAEKVMLHGCSLRAFSDPFDNATVNTAS